MIKYDTGRLGLLFILRLRGSVFPKAILMALPSAGLALLLHTFVYRGVDQNQHAVLNMNGVDFLWAGYTSVLSLLIVFRNNQAYTRFWEGATLISQVRGEWFDAASTIISFTNHEQGFEEQARKFQRMVVRLFSMLYCSALQQVCDFDDDRFEIIECHGMSTDSLDFMHGSVDRCEVILQWIQRLVIEADEARVIKVSAPLLTRFYQELSQGNVFLNNARKIKEVPFPFPYAQLITVMLIIHWISTPVVASQVVESPFIATMMTFFVTFVLWCLVYTTMEIDQPFGEDDNDLPLRDMQRDFNASLLTLMHPLAQTVPPYEWQPVIESEHFADGVVRKRTLENLDSIHDHWSRQGTKEETPFDEIVDTCTMTSASLKTLRAQKERVRATTARPGRTRKSWAFFPSEGASETARSPRRPATPVGPVPLEAEQGEATGGHDGLGSRPEVLTHRLQALGGDQGVVRQPSAVMLRPAHEGDFRLEVDDSFSVPNERNGQQPRCHGDDGAEFELSAPLSERPRTPRTTTSPSKPPSSSDRNKTPPAAAGEQHAGGAGGGTGGTSHGEELQADSPLTHAERENMESLKGGQQQRRRSSRAEC